MVMKRKATDTASTMPVGFTMGALTNLAVTFGGAALCAMLISKGVLSESAIGYCAMVVVLLSAMAGATVAARRIKRRRVIVCGVAGAIYFCILLCMTALFFGGQYQNCGTVALLILAGSVLLIALGLRQEHKPKYRKRRTRNR